MSDITFSVHANQGRYGGELDMSITISDESTLHEVFEVFERMALALTYSPNSLRAAYENRLEAMGNEPSAEYADDFDDMREEFANVKHNGTWASWTYKNAAPSRPHIRSKADASE